MKRSIKIKAQRSFPASKSKKMGFDIEFVFKCEGLSNHALFCFKEDVTEKSDLWMRLNDPFCVQARGIGYKEVSEDDAWSWLYANMVAKGIDWYTDKKQMWCAGQTLARILHENRIERGLTPSFTKKIN